MSEMIQVTTEYLIQKQENLLGARQTANHSFVEATQELTQINECFRAEAVVFLEEVVLRQQQAGQLAFDRLGRQIKKLSEIAQVYLGTERNNADVR